MSPAAEPDLPGGGLGYALARAAHAWRAGLAEALADVEVTPPQFFVLAALLHAETRDRPPPTQRAVAAQTGIDPNTTSQIVRGIERRGLVVRAPSERDSRALALSLTPEGLELASLCGRRARALNREFFAGVDAVPLYETLLGLAAYPVVPSANAASARRPGT
ncbi:MAG TPA: MarR family winged helix-turn-helix transcriptional regulator [Solirubrobacteraceae bacterium]|nr:MarR family winged helix-turn-helix transcriptional regulator [Solirubrobacteraceae bacterium]